jgi:choline transport protein
VTGWQAIVASGCFLCGSLIQGLIVLGNPSYIPQSWQLVLFYWASLLFAIIVNTRISKLLPKIETLILVLHVTGYFAILIPLVYFAPHSDAEVVFTTFLNEGNWPTTGLAFMVGVIGPAFSLLGADGAVHMSEEISRPAQNVPWAMVIGILLNGSLGLGMLIAALFCLGDLDTVLSTPTGYPFMAIFQQAVGDVYGALTMSALITIMNICATISFVATASRMTWSFARDRGVPGWKWLGHVSLIGYQNGIVVNGRANHLPRRSNPKAHYRSGLLHLQQL